MATQSSVKGDLVLGLTPSDAKVLILGILATNDGKVDYEAVAQKGGYKTKESANTMYCNARRKLFRLHGGNTANAPAAGGESMTATPSTPKKGAAQKNKNVPVNNDGDAVSSTTTTPTTTPKKVATPKRKKAPVQNDGDAESALTTTLAPATGSVSDNEQAATPKRQRKTPAKKGAPKAQSPKKTGGNAKVKSEATIKDEDNDVDMEGAELDTAKDEANDDMDATPKASAKKEEDVAE